MKAFKGFNRDMTCRGFQFKEGETYEEPEAKLCERGFHACENPLDCLDYYSPAKSVFHEVELEDVSDERQEDSKVCAKRITIGARLSFAGIVKSAVSFVFGKAKATTGKEAHAATAGFRAYAATTGNEAHAATTGKEAHAATAGFQAHAATTGFRAYAATAGFQAHAATTGFRAYAATTGNWAHAATTGDEAHAEAAGQNSIAAALGAGAKAKGKTGCWIVCSEYAPDGLLLAVKACMVDGESIKPDTWYELSGGKFKEVDE